MSIEKNIKVDATFPVITLIYLMIVLFSKGIILNWGLLYTFIGLDFIWVVIGLIKGWMGRRR